MIKFEDVLPPDELDMDLQDLKEDHGYEPDLGDAHTTS